MGLAFFFAQFFRSSKALKSACSVLRMSECGGFTNCFAPSIMHPMWVYITGAVIALIALVAIYDICQKRHAILRNFPVIGHFRYILEMIGPELRQYIVTNNDEERPFSRDQRRWVYASSKKENDYFGFGSDNEMEAVDNYWIIKHAAFPYPGDLTAAGKSLPAYQIPCAKVMGAAMGRRKAFRPNSVINISAMSYGALSHAAIEAINMGCKISGALHNTGEGGVSSFHLKGGGDLIFQVGTGYFGCRDDQGRFDLDRLAELVEKHSSIRAIEIKLSQGAKPGVGGFLPGAKVTKEIAQARGIQPGKDCASPSGHSAFRNVDEMLDLVESIAERTGLPVGIKSAVGELDFWKQLAQKMSDKKRGVDFITIDGGEGGTGAAPLVFSDHVALPFNLGFARVYKEFASLGLQERIVFIGAGKLGFGERALLGFALGCDMIAVAREAMLSIGCIQAQRCHTQHCPTGIATHQPWLVRGLDPTLKSIRLANYVTALRKELLRLSWSCGVSHPGWVTLDHFELLQSNYVSRTPDEIFGYKPGYGLPSREDCNATEALMKAAIALK